MDVLGGGRSIEASEHHHHYGGDVEPVAELRDDVDAHAPVAEGRGHGEVRAGSRKGVRREMDNSWNGALLVLMEEARERLRGEEDQK